jgi:hypothetical protein
VVKGKKHRLIEVLWYKKEDVVMKEVASLMGLPSADTHTPGWLGYRTQASKNVLNNMSVVDKNALQDQADEIVEKGLPEERQRK